MIKAILAGLFASMMGGGDSQGVYKIQARDNFDAGQAAKKTRTKRTRGTGKMSQPKRRKYLRTNPHMRRYIK